MSERKICTKCGIEKNLLEFHRDSSKKSGRRSDCCKCKTQSVKDRKKNKRMYLVDKYESMKQRVNGTHVSKRHQHIYVGLELMDRDEFIENSLKDPEYNKLHDEWANSNYEYKLAPSTDRVNGDIGYLWENIDWVTHSVNSRNGANSQWNNN